MNDAPYIDIKRFAVHDGPECSYALYGQKTVLPGGRGGTGKRCHSPFFALQPALWSITAVCPQWQQAEYRPPTADWGEDCTEEKC